MDQQARLLINLTNDSSNMTAYFLNEKNNKLQILDISNFSTKNLIANSTITNFDGLREVVQKNYSMILQNTGIERFARVDLVLPFQIPILNEVINKNGKSVYKKKFDESQFFKISDYSFSLPQKKVQYSYFVNQSLFAKYFKLFSELNLKIFRIYTPALLIPQFFSQHSKYNAVIELENKKITYNFYYGQHIFETKSIAQGTDFIFEYLSEKLRERYQLGNDFKINQIIKLLNSESILKSRNAIAMMTFFGDRPVSVMEFFLSSLQKSIRRIALNILNSTFKKFQQELGIVKIDNVCIYKNEFVHTLFCTELEQSGTKWHKTADWKFREADLEIDDPIVKGFFKSRLYKTNKRVNRRSNTHQTTDIITNELKTNFTEKKSSSQKNKKVVKNEHHPIKL